MQGDLPSFASATAWAEVASEKKPPPQSANYVAQLSAQREHPPQLALLEDADTYELAAQPLFGRRLLIDPLPQSFSEHSAHLAAPWSATQAQQQLSDALFGHDDSNSIALQL